MFEARPGEPGVFDFDEIANHLLEQGEQVSPSELHGCLVGLLGSLGRVSADAALAGLNQALGLDLHGELADQILQLHEVTAAAVEDETFDFHPLVPDDDVELAQRTLALAAWCRGFLAGYAQGKVSGGQTGAAVAVDSAEVIKDFAAISQATLEDEQDEDEAEQDYAEILDYIRFAALNVVMDSLSQRAEEGEFDANPLLH
jgi:uncharacterized protein YgfB (UPF0149 family)